MYDDDDDYNGTNDYVYGDPFNMNDSSNQLQFTQCLKTVQFNNYLQAAHHIDTTTKHAQAVPQHTTTKEEHKDSSPAYTYDTLQLLFLNTHYENTQDYKNEFPLYKVPQYIIRKKHPSHDDYLYRRWNTPTVRRTTKKTRTKRLNVKHSSNKDDTSVTPTLQTLCTQDTRSSHQTNIETDTILSITIWNHPIVRYQVPTRPNTRNRSRNPSIAVHHAMIGVYDRLIYPPKISCLLPIFIRIVCVVLSCFILLADSFTLVKIDDRYPDEWND